LETEVSFYDLTHSSSFYSFQQENNEYPLARKANKKGSLNFTYIVKFELN